MHVGDRGPCRHASREFDGFSGEIGGYEERTSQTTGQSGFLLVRVRALPLTRGCDLAPRFVYGFCF